MKEKEERPCRLVGRLLISSSQKSQRTSELSLSLS